MAIDRIGKGGLPPAPVAPPSSKGPGTVERAHGTERPFEVQRERSPEAAKAGNVGGVAAASPMERLRTGQIDLDGYLDLKVEEATAHLPGLSATQLADVRGHLRDRIASDPALADLVRQAAGQAPAPREE